MTDNDGFNVPSFLNSLRFLPLSDFTIFFAKIMCFLEQIYAPTTLNKYSVNQLYISKEEQMEA